MRLRTCLMVLGSALLLLVTGGPTSIAQNQPQRQRNFFEMFWQLPAQSSAQPQRPRVPAQVRRKPAPVMVRDEPAIPKVDVAHHVVVIGDSLAGLLAGGLTDAVADRPDVAVIGRAKSDSGLVRSDFLDWPKQAADILAEDPKIIAGVVLVGLNDRQSLREGEIVHEPLSPRWMELYRQRVAAVAGVFAARRIPLVWAGVPPMQNQRLSVDFANLNDLYRQEIDRAGGTYVDLWGAFVDAENRYAASGPDVSGQPTRLRLGDGIHFTAAGARKAAHFVDVVLRRLLDAQPRQEMIAAPSPAEPGAPEQPRANVERLIDDMVGNVSTNFGLASALQAKPVAGPIQPLTGLMAAPEQALLVSIGDARGRGEAAAVLDRIYGDGVLPEPKPGRLDDTRWPR